MSGKGSVKEPWDDEKHFSSFHVEEKKHVCRCATHKYVIEATLEGSRMSVALLVPDRWFQRKDSFILDLKKQTKKQVVQDILICDRGNEWCTGQASSAILVLADGTSFAV